MIRKPRNKPDAILTSDWHLRDTPPPCRTDDFESAQWNKVNFISELQHKYNCPVIHAGDLFHHWKPSPYLLAKTMEYLPNDFFTIYGNHDLPQHNLEMANKCGIYVLEKAGKLTMLNSGHWNIQNLIPIPKIAGNKNVLVWHVMTYQGSKSFPGDTSTPARGLLRKYSKYDLIVTGHNHQSFTESHEGRLLVNPGLITRQESDQKDWKPKVYLYYAETNSVQAIEIPIESGVVQKPANIQKIEERNERLDAFITKLNADWDSTINFDLNLERHLKANNINQEVQQIIYECLET